jgi:hypothetical protein
LVILRTPKPLFTWGGQTTPSVKPLPRLLWRLRGGYPLGKIEIYLTPSAWVFAFIKNHKSPKIPKNPKNPKNPKIPIIGAYRILGFLGFFIA